MLSPVLLNPLEKIILRELAQAYLAYTHESVPAELRQDWPNNRKAIYTGSGSDTVDKCYGAAFMHDVLNILAKALCDVDENGENSSQASQVCKMFDGLYKKDPKITSSIKAAWVKSPLKIDQIDKGTNLGSILANGSVFPPAQPKIFTFEKAPDETKKTTTKQKIAHIFGF